MPTQSLLLIIFSKEAPRVKAITTFVNQRKKENNINFIAKSSTNSPFCSDQLSGKADIITDATLSYKDLTFENIHLRKINGTSPLGNFLYEPILFTADTAIKLHDRIRAALCDTVLLGIQATSTGKSTAVFICCNQPNGAWNDKYWENLAEFIKGKINAQPGG